MKDSTSSIRGWTLCLLSIALLSVCVLASPYSRVRELWEGSQCELKDGRNGECVKAVDCPKKVMDIRHGNWTDEGRCSFWKFDEIVCCEKKMTDKIRRNPVRPAVAACEMYKKSLRKHREDEAAFSIVVYNGVSANPGEFPQMVALGYPAGPDDELVIDGIKYICGGTLISDKHVLTAAHCVSNIQGFVPTEVVLGTIELNVTKTKRLMRVPISKIVKHPKHRGSQHYNDIAVIELKNPVQFTNDVKPACLATEPFPKPNDSSSIRLVVLGWGAIDMDGTRSTKLLKADWLEYVERNKCSETYKNAGASILRGLDDGMICVADPNTERKSDTCWGDSGGPLFIKNDEFPPLIGVTSFGHFCGSGTPGVYASVYKYLDWIEDQVWPAGAR